MSRTLLFCIASCCLVAGCDRPSSSKTVTLTAVNYDALCEAVKAQRDKVVVLDIWGDF